MPSFFATLDSNLIPTFPYILGIYILLVSHMAMMVIWDLIKVML